MQTVEHFKKNCSRSPVANEALIGRLMQNKQIDAAISFLDLI